MLVAWRENVQVQVISSTEFCMELQVTIEVEKEKCWTTIVHASTNSNERMTIGRVKERTE